MKCSYLINGKSLSFEDHSRLKINLSSYVLIHLCCHLSNFHRNSNDNFLTKALPLLNEHVFIKIKEQMCQGKKTLLHDCTTQIILISFKDWGGRLLNDLLIKSIFSISILSSSFRIWLYLNRGVEWESLD